VIIESKKLLSFNYFHIFDVVLDIAKYPEFLPWCDKVVISNIKDDSLSAILYIKFLKISVNYTSDIMFLKPTQNNSGYIKSISNNGPFKHLYNNWIFEYIDNNHTMTSCITEINFKSYILQKTFGKVYRNKQEKIILAFEKRLERLYGNILKLI